MDSLFLYKVKTRTGKDEQGNIKAADIKKAAEYLIEQGFYIVDIVPQHRSYWTGVVNNKITENLVGDFFSQLAFMLNAGISLRKSIGIYNKQLKNKQMQELIADVGERIERGDSFSKALADSNRIFSGFMIAFAEVGETSGHLADNLARLGAEINRAAALRQKVKMAMLYPMVVIATTAALTIFLFVFVFPIFAELMNSLDVEMPLVTRILFCISGIIRDYWYMMIGLAAIAGWSVFFTYRKERYRRYYELIILRLPVIGRIVREKAIVRFSQMMACLLASGVSMQQSLTILKGITGELFMQLAIDSIEKSIIQGLPLSGCLQETGVFPEFMVELVGVGEASGHIDTALETVGNYYYKKIEQQTIRLSRMIEPALLAVMAVIVGNVVFSVILPIFSIMDRIIM